MHSRLSSKPSDVNPPTGVTRSTRPMSSHTATAQNKMQTHLAQHGKTMKGKRPPMLTAHLCTPDRRTSKRAVVTRRGGPVVFCSLRARFQAQAPVDPASKLCRCTFRCRQLRIHRSLSSWHMNTRLFQHLPHSFSFMGVVACVRPKFAANPSSIPPTPTNNKPHVFSIPNFRCSRQIMFCFVLVHLSRFCLLFLECDARKNHPNKSEAKSPAGPAPQLRSLRVRRLHRSSDTRVRLRLPRNQPVRPPCVCHCLRQQCEFQCVPPPPPQVVPLFCQICTVLPLPPGF